MKYNFNKAYELLSDLEGFDKGLHKNPTETDVTFCGIYKRYHNDWEGWNYIERGDKVPEKLVVDFYKKEFWSKVKGDKLPSGLDTTLFDYAVNSDPSDAVKSLQQVLGVKDDGIIGKKTLSKVDSVIEKDPKLGLTHLITEVNAKRLSHMLSCPEEDRVVYGLGWSRRVCLVLSDSLQIAVPF